MIADFMLCMLLLQPGFWELPEDVVNSFWVLTPKELATALPKKIRQERAFQVCPASKVRTYA